MFCFSVAVNWVHAPPPQSDESESIGGIENDDKNMKTLNKHDAISDILVWEEFFF